MEYSLIYIQANEKLGRTIREYLLKEDLEVLVAQSAAQAFEILEARRVALILMDSYIPDMRQRDLIDMLCSKYPKVILNICMDMADPTYLASVSAKPNVWKIHVPPLSIEKMVEGVLSSVDRMCIEKDFSDREASIREEEIKFEQTLANLKATLKRQQYSYNTIKPFFDAMLEGFYTKSGLDEKCRNLLRESAKKMLLLQTTASLKTGDLGNTISEALRTIYTIETMDMQNKHIEIENIDNCLKGEVNKKTLGNIVFSVWFSCLAELLECNEISVNVDSRYLSSDKCEFTVEILSENHQYDEKIHEMIIGTLLLTCKEALRQIVSGSRRYTLIFEL